MSNERGTAAYENEEFVNLQQTLEFEMMAELGTLKESNMASVDANYEKRLLFQR